MTKKRRYHPRVASDLSAATEYHDGVSVELRNRFRASVRGRLRVVAERPESFARIHGKMRAAMLNHFPYVVLFEDYHDRIVVLGVFHAASDQSGWFSRSL